MLLLDLGSWMAIFSYPSFLSVYILMLVDASNFKSSDMVEFEPD
jgi:hypothetical protein